VSLSTGKWLLTIMLLTGALVTPVMGRLPDGPRQRDVILFALVCVVAGCVLAAVSENFAELILGRGLQGVGLGILPVAMAIARRHLAPEQARRTIATLSVTTAIGVGLGYPVTPARSIRCGIPPIGHPRSHPPQPGRPERAWCWLRPMPRGHRRKPNDHLSGENR
jgi:MFS family permease